MFIRNYVMKKTQLKTSVLVEKDAGSGTDISVRGLSKEYVQDGKTIRVLSDITLDIPKGQAVALVGHNGSGKSTLLRCCLRLVEPTSGKVSILGRDILSCKGTELRNLRSRVGFIFQGHNLVPRLSAFSNVLHGAQGRKRGPKVWYHWLAEDADREQAIRCLDRVGLARLALRRSDKLSGGESQRVAIARALMQQAKLIFADEPVASLDPNAGRDIMELFFKLIRDEGLTFMFVSHNLEHALQYSDRVIGLRGGNLELDSPSKDLDVESLRGLYD